jgi:glycerol-3-phosphate cytidylyltransferase
MINDKTIVYTGGTFDMFHSNHVRMIEYAKGLGDKLIVGVSTDELVCSYKDNPIVPFEERIEIVKALKQPDMVVPQHSLEHAELVKNLHVDAFVIGDDWEGKYDYLEELGVKVFYFPYGKGASSTNIKKKIHVQYDNLKAMADKHGNPDIK